MSDDTSSTIDIPFPATIGMAETTDLQKVLSEGLENASNSGNTIRLMLSDVKKPCTAFVQLLLVAQKQAKSDNVHMQWVAPSKKLVRAFNDLGLYAQMMQAECVA
jgi:anti-anti-sigma regulatory factor